MSVMLYKFGPVMGLPDPSPFCFKLETYLRMAGIKYTVASDKRRRLLRASAPSWWMKVAKSWPIAA